jgi:hypothetical protein
MNAISRHCHGLNYGQHGAKEHLKRRIEVGTGRARRNADDALRTAATRRVSEVGFCGLPLYTNGYVEKSRPGGSPPAQLLLLTA